MAGGSSAMCYDSNNLILIANPVSSSPTGMFVRATYTEKKLPSQNPPVGFSICASAQTERPSAPTEVGALRRKSQPTIAAAMRCGLGAHALLVVAGIVLGATAADVGIGSLAHQLAGDAATPGGGGGEAGARADLALLGAIRARRQQQRQARQQAAQPASGATRRRRPRTYNRRAHQTRFLLAGNSAASPQK